jgi:AcrR family transcriptional regulator
LVWTYFVKYYIVSVGIKRRSVAVVLGRPRCFDVDDALDKALEVFWTKGYEGTSLTDLTKAMGINRPSLYAAFGNKEQLFNKALEKYADKVCFLKIALEEKTAAKVLETLLLSNADSLTEPDSPHGCLAVQGALTCGEEAETVRMALASLRASGEKKIRERLERAKKEGDLAPSAKPAEIARYISTVMHGMSVQASSGASRKDLRQVAKMAFQALNGVVK